MFMRIVSKIVVFHEIKINFDLRRTTYVDEILPHSITSYVAKLNHVYE